MILQDLDEEEEKNLVLEKIKLQSQIDADPSSVGSDDFQDFESYQTQQSTNTEQKPHNNQTDMTHSSTNDSINEIQGKMFTPSLVSSGYGSQAVSLLTLSSEDSLSLRSNEDNGDGKDGRGTLKGTMEHAHSSSSTASESELEEQTINMVTDGDDLEEKGAENSTENHSLESESLSTNTTDEFEQRKRDAILDLSDGSYLDSSNSIGQKNISSENILTAGASADLCGASSHGNHTNNASVDAYSENAMEELERLGLDDEVEESTDFNESEMKEHKMDLFIKDDIHEGNIQSSGITSESTPIKPKQREVTPPNSLERKVVKRPRPASCIMTPPSELTASLIEESMKRNSLSLDTSDDLDISGM